MSLVLEGAETRRRVCIRCGEELTSSRQTKYCSARCRNAEIVYNHAVRTGRIKQPGVGSGGAQYGEDNHQYKTGIGSYSHRGFEAHGRNCTRCDAEAVLIHHKDHDRRNNGVENLEPLCKRCHQHHHTVRDIVSGQYTKV